MANLRQTFAEAFGPTRDRLIDRFVTVTAASGHAGTLVRTRIKKMLDYTVPGGKNERGLLFLNSYLALKSNRTQTGANALSEQVLRLGWMHELLQSYFLVADDVMDDGELRRGKPCWFRQPSIGLSAVNDALLLERLISMNIRCDFPPNQAEQLVEAFDNTNRDTVCGQLLDIEEKKVDDFTLELYMTLVRLKTSIYTFVLPVESALILTDRYDLMHTCRQLGFEMGFYFQAQDDYLDCFGDKTKLGKDSQDIQNGKCSWLAVMALQRLRNDPIMHDAFVELMSLMKKLLNWFQRHATKENYGCNAPESVDKIRRLYEKLKLPVLYKDFETCQKDEISQNIAKLRHPKLETVYSELLQKLAAREK